MAGRGTDIKLGQGVTDLGGLAVIGTERHESRRIDDQLRGRSGRQGDPGSSQFYLSLEDDLMRRFGSERVQRLLEAFKIEGDDAVIKSKMITRQIESAQKRVEGNNYDSRKNVLQYDDVIREQREITYAQRYDVITATRDLSPELLGMFSRTVARLVDHHAPEGKFVGEDVYTDLTNELQGSILSEDALTIDEINGKTPGEVKAIIFDKVKTRYQHQLDAMRALVQTDEEKKQIVIANQKRFILNFVDRNWSDHIDALDQMRQSVGLRGYAQNNPIVEYQEESFRMFQEMIGQIEFEITRTFMKAQIRQAPVEERPVAAATPNNGLISEDDNQQPTPGEGQYDFSNVGRNDPCPCGSGKKFKNCHGRKLQA
jgi:preprotein translocase subunit SecA